jgi:quercetin dioxygenase-like cupin family protein
MSHTVIRKAEARRTETPNAVMTTFASPTQGGSAALSMWQVEMSAGQQGPPHVFATEQLWTVVQGAVEIAVGGDRVELLAGDTVVLPAGAVRQVTATLASRLIVCGRGDAEVTVPGEAGSRGVPPWIA